MSPGARGVWAGALLVAACHEPNPVSPDPGTSSGGSSTAAVDSTGAEGTTTAEPRPRAPLIDPRAWVPVDADDDPLPNHRPSEVTCSAVGAYPEGTGYEIDTGSCNYCSRTQPSLVDIEAGDTLRVVAFHERLASVEAGQAHFALLLDTWPVWQEFIPIPASPGIVDATPFSEEIVIDVDVPAGTPVGLHLHNHGYNTWNLLEVEVVPPEAR